MYAVKRIAPNSYKIIVYQIIGADNEDDVTPKEEFNSALIKDQPASQFSILHDFPITVDGATAIRNNRVIGNHCKNQIIYYNYFTEELSVYSYEGELLCAFKSCSSNPVISLDRSFYAYIEGCSHINVKLFNGQAQKCTEFKVEFPTMENIYKLMLLSDDRSCIVFADQYIHNIDLISGKASSQFTPIPFKLAQHK